MLKENLVDTRFEAPLAQTLLPYENIPSEAFAAYDEDSFSTKSSVADYRIGK